MKVKAEIATVSEGVIDNKETDVTANGVEKAVEEWVKWFQTQLKQALANNEDVEIFFGRKPNGVEFQNKSSNNHIYV